MKVFKFGGASLRHAAAIKNAARIIESASGDSILVVGSAIGKTTNALEKVVELIAQNRPADKDLTALEGYHIAIMDELFGPGDNVFTLVKEQFDTIRRMSPGGLEYDCIYDHVVARGELISTIILAEFLKKSIPAQWIDARDYVITDSHFREGRVEWTLTQQRIRQLRPRLEGNVLVTQGFIGQDLHGKTTTLGREGSDYTAAIFGRHPRTLAIQSTHLMMMYFLSPPKMENAHTILQFVKTAVATVISIGSKCCPTNLKRRSQLWRLL